MKKDKTELEVDPQSAIGKKVCKFSGKPFKSRLKDNTVKDVTTNIYTGKIAFTFVEDDSVVDIIKCELSK